jgi:hypothetical protein
MGDLPDFKAPHMGGWGVKVNVNPHIYQVSFSIKKNKVLLCKFVIS